VKSQRLPLKWIDIIRAALFALEQWTFEHVPREETSLDPSESSALEQLGDRLTAEILPLHQRLGVALDPDNNREVFRRRATLSAALELSAAELALIHRALTLCEREFDWSIKEFCMVTPGGLSWYPVTAEDLRACREEIGRLRNT